MWASQMDISLQFPLWGIDGVRFRVGDEWRGYTRGKVSVQPGRTGVWGGILQSNPLPL